MNFAFFGYDYSLDVATRLIAEGHTLRHIFTFECDNLFSFNAATKNFAQENNIPISEAPPKQEQLNKLIDDGCQLLLSAGFPHKIPTIDHSECYGINVHPSLLPRARGIMPLPYIILNEQEAAGFTIHKHSPDFDEGDILYQQDIPIDKHTDIETLSAQIAIKTPAAVSEVIKNIDYYWNNATRQNQAEATLHNKPSENMRTINWTQNVGSIIKQSKAFGRFGIIAIIHNNIGQSQRLAVFQLSGWKDNHPHKNGELIRSSPREIIIAVQDGYICLKEFQVLE